MLISELIRSTIELKDADLIICINNDNAEMKIYYRIERDLYIKRINRDAQSY